MVETPEYLIKKRVGEAELRQYKNIILVTATKNKVDSYSVFGLLAGYIFGGNEKGEKIKMTAPVITSNENNLFSMSFIMPRKYSMKALPKPLKNNKLKFEQFKVMKLLVLRFSGSVNDDKVLKQTEMLKKILKENNLKPKRIFLMQYNPPWTLPFLRRNEIAAQI
ncbi:MAG: SOUL family heme-binding protein [Candidatus Micrarchaeia archaeon]